MSTWHLHARLLRGPLCAPEANELQTGESDHRDDMERLAVELQGRGFSVWLYEHHGDAHTAHEAGYRCIREWRPGGPLAGVSPAIVRPDSRAATGKN